MAATQLKRKKKTLAELQLSKSPFAKLEDVTVGDFPLVGYSIVGRPNEAGLCQIFCLCDKPAVIREGRITCALSHCSFFVPAEGGMMYYTQEIMAKVLGLEISEDKISKINIVWLWPYCVCNHSFKMNLWESKFPEVAPFRWTATCQNKLCQVRTVSQKELMSKLTEYFDQHKDIQEMFVNQVEGK